MTAVPYKQFTIELHPRVFYCAQTDYRGTSQLLENTCLRNAPYELLSTSGLAGCLADFTCDYGSRSGRGPRTLNTQRAASLTSRATTRVAVVTGHRTPHTLQTPQDHNQPRLPQATHRRQYRSKSALKQSKSRLNIVTSPGLAVPRSLTPLPGCRRA